MGQNTHNNNKVGKEKMAAAKDLTTELIELCDAACDNDNERLSHLHDALATIRERLDISTAKAEGGTLGESWIAKHFGLKWENACKTGADATDATGRACEIKASLHPLKTKIRTHKTNICYKTLHRRTNEEDDVFVARMQAHIRENTGGHFWGTWVEKTPAGGNDRIVLRWWVPSGPLAQLIGKKMRTSGDMKKKSKVIAINFGAQVCRACTGVHRIDKIVRALGGWNGRTDSWESLATKRGNDHGEISDAVIATLTNTCNSQC